MQHTGAPVGGAYTACIRVTNNKRESGKDQDDNDKSDNDKSDKKDNNKERTSK